MLLNIDMKKCTGCGACVQRCPQKCISWKAGELDFKYPEIDRDHCIDCGLCEKVCPIEKKLSVIENQKAYAAVHNSLDVLEKSTSGGAFTAIAEAVFGMGGVVYGVTMQDDMQVKHIRVENRSDLGILRGSKYIQSDTADTYQKVERDLRAGTKVLYSGTPCQIDGLKHFLQKDYTNLYTVDIVCHGVGSQGYFNRYMEFAESRYGNIKILKFRSKEFDGWSCGSGEFCVEGILGTRKKIPFRDFDNYYYSYFLSGDIYRMCCYTCKYANIRRPGDFTLGDYWGVEALKLSLSTRRGCSLLLVNSEKAEKMMKLISGIYNLQLVETSIEQATHCNKQLNAPSPLPESRKQRITEYKSMSGNEIQNLYLKTHWKTVLKGKLKSMIPYRVKLFIRSKRK